MAYSAAKAASNKKSDEKYSQMLLKPYKAEAERIRTAAQAAGQSLQGFILQACRERMERDSAAVAADEPVSSAGAAQECGAVSIPSEALEAVRVAAEAAGMSVDAWIVQAIKDKL